jgi:hypothetical protein
MLLKYLFRQPVHILQSLAPVSKIEISFIILTLYTFLSERLYFFIPQWQNRLSLSAAQTAYIISAIHIISFLIAAPFILQRLIPRQKQLLTFYTLPLKSKDVITITAYYFYKYLIIIPLIFSPLFTALFFRYPLTGFYNLFIVLYAALSVYLLFLSALNSVHNKNTLYMYTAFYILLYLVLFLSVFLLFKSILFINLIFLIAVSILISIKYPSLKTSDINHIFPIKKDYQILNTNRKSSFITIPHIFSDNMRILLNKELINLWRNPGYRKIKSFTTLLYIISLSIIIIKKPLLQENWMLIISLTAVWLHYGNHFSDKYISSDPDWFFHTLPLKYSRMWLAKFITEFIYITLILLIQTIFFIIGDFTLKTVLSFDILLLIFSIIVLAVKLNFQILLYDSPRLAGYAYHFTLLFIVIMCINYRFVGPLISLFLLISYFYKSYRYFKG